MADEPVPPVPPAESGEPKGSAAEDEAKVDDFVSMVEHVQKKAKQEQAPLFAQKAWICLDKDAFPRKQCIQIVSSVWFERIVLTLIMVNCLTMTLTSSPLVKRIIEGEYFGGSVTAAQLSQKSLWASQHWTFSLLRPASNCNLNDSMPCSVAQIVDFIFLILFTIEMVLKMLASGLALHPHSYLRSGWNWLDFVVVIVGYVERFAGGTAAIKAIRLVKTFRPLRAMNRIRGMRVLVQCILEAVPQMMNAAVLLFFTILLFALFGHAFFKGKLRHTCHACGEWSGGVCVGGWESTGDTCDAECTFDDLGVLKGSCAALGASTFQNQSDMRPGIWTYSCRAEERCLCTSEGKDDDPEQYGEDFLDAYPNWLAKFPNIRKPKMAVETAWCDYLSNPNYGITSFDSVPWAMVSLFQAISLEGWVDMMYQLMDGNSVWVCIYFVLLVLFGAIIVMNIFLAVLCDNFQMADKEDGGQEKGEDVEEVMQKAIASLEHKNGLRQMCLNLMRVKQFDYFVQGCILFNTLLMCVKYSPGPTNWLRMSVTGDETWDYMPTGLAVALMVLNILLTLIFTVESVVKVCALGTTLFKRDFMNVFDAFVVAFSIVEIALDLNSKSNPSAPSLPIPLSVLRAFRVFRLFKLAKSIKSMRKILAKLASSLSSLVYLALLLCLFILIFILLGMELFGGRYPNPALNYTVYNFPETFNKYSIYWDDDWGSRYHFDDFGSSFLAIFVVLSGENWNEIMFDSHRASWTGGDFPASAIIYFLILFVVGNLLLFNLFIAILLEQDDEEEEEEEEPDDGKEDRDVMIFQFGQYVNPKKPGLEHRKSSGNLEADAAAGGEAAEDQVLQYPESVADGNGDKSLMVFGWDSPVRVTCCKIILHPYFEPVVVFAILVSTLFLVIDMPHLSEKSGLRTVLSIFNYIFTILFTLEMLLKIVAQGFIVSKTDSKYAFGEAYMRSGWNVLDFAVVLVSILALILADQKGIKPLRALRAFRPMRLVQRYESLKVTFQTLLASIPSMFSLMSVAMLFFVIFAILGLELFGGKLGYCADPGHDDGRITPGMDGKQNDYEECMALSRYNLTRRTSDGILLTDMADMEPNANPSWLVFTEFPQWMYPQFGTFDNIGMSLMLLFEISALEGWPDVMHAAMDSDSRNMFVEPYRVDSNPLDFYSPDDWDKSAPGLPRPDGVPEHEHVTSNVTAAIFFILWIIFGCFVIVNMTVSVVCDTFSMIKAKNDGLLLMTEEEADWIKTQKEIFAQRPLISAVKPAEAWRLPFFKLVQSTEFEVGIMCVIMANVVQMATDWFEPNPAAQAYMPALKSAMGVFNVVFFVIYVLELVAKWIGMGVKQYFKNTWNMFDFFLVVVSLIEIIISASNGETPFPADVLRALRLFRVARILRIVKTAKSLRTIMMTVYVSVPQLKNIMMLMSLIILVADMLLVGFYSSVNYTPGYYAASYSYYHDQAPASIDKDANKLYGDKYRGEVYNPEDYFYSDTTNWGEMINRHANFAYFWVGLLTLIRSSTGESFNGIMHDLAGYEWGHNRLTCNPQGGPVMDGAWQQVTIPSTGETLMRIVPDSSCGSSVPAWLIYLVFQMVTAYIVLSIMIGVILENFASVGVEGYKVSMDDLENFREVWVQFDPKGTFVVPSHNLLAILQQLKKPLGIKDMEPAMTRSEMLKHLSKISVPDHNGYIHFLETLTAISNAAAGVPLPACETTSKLAKSAAAIPRIRNLEKAKNTAHAHYLVSLMQTRWHRYKQSQGGGDGGGGAKPAQVAPA